MENQTLDQWLESVNKAFRLGFKCERIAKRPDQSALSQAGSWPAESRHFKITLNRSDKRMTVYFSQGSAHTKDPVPYDLMECLSSDISDTMNGESFEDWCSNYGYDTDSRSAERTYKACGKTYKDMQRLFSEQELRDLVSSEKL